MRVIRGGFGSRKTPSVGLVLGAGGVVGQAYQAGVLAALQREIGWDPAPGQRDRRHLRRRGHRERRCALGVPGPDLAASLYGVPPSRQGAAILRRILPPDSEPLPTPSVLSRCSDPGTCPRPRSSPGWPAGPSPSGPRWPCPRSSPRVRSTSASGPGASTSSSASAGPRGSASAPSAGTTAPGSSSAAPARHRPAWPRPCWPRAPSPATSAPSPSTAPSTSTGASTR